VSDTPSGDDRAQLFNRLRDGLVTEQTNLAEQLDALEGSGTSSGFDDHFADTAQVSAEQGESRLLAGELREQLDDVEFAIGRLVEGTYGTCVACGAAIGDARLEAMPATRWCIEHAPG
jgi:RNA polymerase-binding transcription factor DksA